MRGGGDSSNKHSEILVSCSALNEMVIEPYEMSKNLAESDIGKL